MWSGGASRGERAVSSTTADTTVIELTADDFARRFALRAANLMWLLGAGASAAGGMPTAWDMIWEFKQRLYVSQRRVTLQSVSDLSSSAIRVRLQDHIDSSGGLPGSGDPDEYAALFEAVYPAESDRRAYLDSKTRGAKPSYGHLALATLMRALKAQLVWTTNFDPLVADACATVFGTTGALATVDLDAPDTAAQLLAEGRWPVEIKLHGDFRSRRLKNTTDELRHQDERLRQHLVQSCSRFGLVVVGYSGRDTSILEALRAALKSEGAFPLGLFWLHRGDHPPLPAVEKLLTDAVQAGVEAVLVRIDNFDEALRDLLRMFEDVDTSELDAFAADRRRWTPAPTPAGRHGWPVVRLNALPVVEMPQVCRRIECRIGGHREVRAAVDLSGADILFARSSLGVLAYGSDADVRRTFDGYGIVSFDLHTIEKRRLRYDSHERGLLRVALARALAGRRGLSVSRRRSIDLLAPTDVTRPEWEPLRSLVGKLSGTVSGHPELQWREGVGTRLDWADDRLWLLMEPRTVFEGISDANKSAATDFSRERTIKRYNQKLNDLVVFWAGILAGDGGDLSALGIGDGVDAVFRLSHDTGFSRRTQS